MAAFGVRVAPATFEKNGAGPVVGHIWIECGEHSFPEVGWYDFPTTVLAWWLEAIRNRTDESGEMRFVFMDGPFECRLLPRPGGELAVVEFLKRRAGGADRLGSSEADCATIARAVLDAAVVSLRECESHSWAG